MPISGIKGPKHIRFELKPYPGSRFMSTGGSDVYLECPTKDARANIEWLRQWIDKRLVPEVDAIEASIQAELEKKKNQRTFVKGVYQQKISPEIVAAQQRAKLANMTHTVPDVDRMKIEIAESVKMVSHDVDSDDNSDEEVGIDHE